MLVTFVTGVSPNASVHEAVLAEQKQHGDIIIGNFLDTYHNLTMKTMFLLKYFADSIPNARFLLKIDDNVCLNLTLILERLVQYRDTNIVFGHVMHKFPVVRDQTSKWYVSEEEYPDYHYPQYVAGPAYVLGMTAVRNILHVCGDIKTPLYIEDVFVTGICRIKATVMIRSDYYFCYNIDSKSKLCATDHRENTNFLMNISAQLVSD